MCLKFDVCQKRRGFFKTQIKQPPDMSPPPLSLSLFKAFSKVRARIPKFSRTLDNKRYFSSFNFSFYELLISMFNKVGVKLFSSVFHALKYPKKRNTKFDAKKRHGASTTSVYENLHVS